MSEIILTAINDKDSYWFECFVPFIVSLKETNYKGDIGVISYKLSENKKEVLKKNNILVFEGENYFSELVIDRQWMAAEIGEKYGYKKVALYDSDIWFPKQDLTIFTQLESEEKLYCNYDIFYSNFILSSVKEHKREEVKEKIEKLLKRNKKIWKVGLIGGKTSAWIKYKKYMENTIKKEDFIMKFGVDTTSILLYSYEKDGVEHLPDHYDCLPNGGLYMTNISKDNKILENDAFFLNGKEIEGLHIPGTFRQWNGHFYDYVNWRGKTYYKEGPKYRLHNYEFKELNKNIILEIFKNKFVKNENLLNLKLDKIFVENQLSVRFQENDVEIITSGSFRMILKNENKQPIKVKIAIYEEFNYQLSKEAFVTLNGKYMQIKIKNQWFELELDSNDELALGSYDLNPENTRLVWRIEKVNLY